MMQIKSNKVPKILFIRGVFKKDCLNDDIFDRKYNENASIVDINSNILNDEQYQLDNLLITNYEKLPPIFNSIETWKKKTNLLCWSCTLSFNTIPVFIPKVIEPMSTKDQTEFEKYSNTVSKTNSKSNSKTNQKFSISVYGVFCTFGCAIHYIESHNYSITDRTEAKCKLKILHKLYYNKDMKDISYYPSPSQMKKFGGDLTDEEYKESMEKYKKENY